MKIVILSGHPRADSFTHALASAYQKAAETAGAETALFSLSALDLGTEHLPQKPSKTDWNEDIAALWDAIERADHLVFAHPLWWGTMPAELKRLFDRLWLPGLAYSYQKGNPFPLGLLRGKTAEVIMTSDTPDWYYRLGYGQAQTKLMKNQILKFVGLKPVKFIHVSPVFKMKEGARQRQLEKVAARAASFVLDHKKSAA